MTFKQGYKNTFDKISPGEALIGSVLKKRNTYKALIRPAIAAALVFVFIFAGLPAAVAAFEPVYQIMYLVSPAAAQYFMPVQLKDEDNGVCMEVVSAYIHENTAEIYISLTDLTGDRIDETVDLYDSYSIMRPFDSSAVCRRTSYDPDTKTAYFLITIEEWGNHSIEGDKLTFIVREFISRKRTYEDIFVPLDLTKAEDAGSQTVSPNGWGGLGAADFSGEARVLVPSSPMPFPVDGIELTGMGYIDGLLHIQTAVHDPLSNDNFGFFYLLDEDGNILISNYIVYYTNGIADSGRTDYSNHVFDIPPEELSRYKLYGTFYTSGLYTSGNWRVTFPLETAKE